MARKTVHVIPKNGAWVVTREGDRTHRFATQREAIARARLMLKHGHSGQLVIYGRDGHIRRRDTFGMPPILEPPGKRNATIEKAVDKITRVRLGADLPGA